MGAWGIKNFENDGAADFVEDVLQGNKLIIPNTIQKILELSNHDYLGIPDCEQGLAAVEFIAAAKGKPSVDMSDKAIEWIKKNDLLSFSDFDLIASAQNVIYHVLDDSEMKELWKEAGELKDWEKVIADLKERIS
ncbi:MAG TPA: DUF4259 domain-containing protein [Bacteroidia bacterium]|jgi:hypothetical protein|nr:DUF4259 domain-containing protein [Bacteroidia bacterium]